MTSLVKRLVYVTDHATSIIAVTGIHNKAIVRRILATSSFESILPLFYTVPPPRQYPIFAIFVTNLCYTQELIPQPRRRYTLTAPRSAHQPAAAHSPDDGEWSAPNNTAASPPRAHCPCPHTPATSPPAPVSTQAPRPPLRHRHTGFNRTSNPAPSRRQRSKSSRKPASGQRSHTTGM
jgi:hypothetical protein